MALIKYGGGIIQMSGSVAGNTHARNRFGNYMRARTKPVNPKSSRQGVARTIIRYLAEEWRSPSMDDAKRLAWEVYAAGVAWNNALGETVKLTGFNMFIRANAVLMRAEQDIVLDGPPDIGLPAGDPDFAINDAGAAAKSIGFTFKADMDWCDETGAHLVIEMGMPQNPTRNFFGGPWRYMGRLGGKTGDPPTPVVNLSTVQWTLVEGQKIWVRGAILRADARISTKFTPAPFVVTA